MHGSWSSSHAANYKDLDKKFCSLPNFSEMEYLIDFKYSKNVRNISTGQIKNGKQENRRKWKRQRSANDPNCLKLKPE